ncbi:MAG: hypothetical protein IBX55_18970 [Methyloprofundus sp.]|nr:hypothetical protein [Methyloprofundus sp.]
MNKFIFVITGLGMGGAENQVVSLADKLADKGLDLTIVYPYLFLIYSVFVLMLVGLFF